MNKVETAVRITHIPTGVIASSRVERSQMANRQLAMNLLRGRLVKLMEEQQAKEVTDLKTRVKVEWGSQIRSYVLNPYKMVKDHRTGVETSQVERVLGENWTNSSMRNWDHKNGSRMQPVFCRWTRCDEI